MAQPSDENENYVAHLKAESLLKTTVETASKLGNKRQRNACSNYATLEGTVLRTRSVTNKKQEAQPMLTTGSTRSAVSRGQQTWYHFGSIATFR